MTAKQRMDERLDQIRRDPRGLFEDLVIPSSRGMVRFGTIMEPFQREWINALAPSLAALAHGELPPIRRYFIDATKGSGKDLILALSLCYLLYFARRPMLIEIGANDQEQGTETRKSLREILRCTGWLNALIYQAVEIKATSAVNETNGVVVEILARNAFGRHGSRPDVVVINELTHIADEDFAETLADNATKMPRGLMLIGSNAGTLDSWQHRWKVDAMEDAGCYVGEYKQPAPWLDPADIERARRRNPPARFQRLYYGVWSTGASDALDRDDIDRAFDAELLPMTGRESGYVFAGGLDLSTTKDHSAWCVVGKHRNGRFRLADLRIWRPTIAKKIDQAEIERTILESHARYHLKKVRADRYQAEYVTDRLRLQGVPVDCPQQSGTLLIEQATVLIEQFASGNIDLYGHPQLERELREVRLMEKQYGFKLESPREDGHGDAVSALSIALTMCRPLLPAAHHTTGWLPQQDVLDSLRGDGNARSRPATQLRWGGSRLGSGTF
jgi:phage terminase large subunit-like protein